MRTRSFIYLSLISILFPHFGYSQNVQQKEHSPKGSWNSESKILSIGYGYPAFRPLVVTKRSESARSSTLVSFETEYGAHLKFELARNHWGFGVSANRSVMFYDMQYYLNYAIHNYRVVEKVQTVNLRANYHFLMEKIIDPYVGIGGGIRIINYRISDDNIQPDDKIPLGMEITIGLRCLILSRVGIYAECGIGRTLYQGGLSFNFGY